MVRSGWTRAGLLQEVRRLRAEVEAASGGDDHALVVALAEGRADKTLKHQMQMSLVMENIVRLHAHLATAMDEQILDEDGPACKLRPPCGISVGEPLDCRPHLRSPMPPRQCARD